HSTYKAAALATILAIAACGDTSSAAQPASTDPAALTPGDAVLFVGTPDVGALWHSIIRETGATLGAVESQYSGDAGLAIATRVLFRLRQRLADALQTEPVKLENPFGGPALLYITMPSAGDTIEMGCAFGVGNAALMRDYYDKITKRMRDIFSDTRSEKVGDAEIVEFRRKPDPSQATNGSDPNDFDFGDADAALDLGIERLLSPDSLPDHIAACLTPKVLWVGSSADMIKSAMSVKPGEDALSDTPAYKRLEQVYTPLGQARVLLNIASIRRLAERRQGPDAQALFETLGLDHVDAIVGHGSLQVDGGNFSEFLFVSDKKPTGLLGLLALENTPITPDGTISANTCLYARLNLNVGEFVRETEAILRRQDPDTADAMRRALEDAPGPDGERVNLRAEVIDSLNGPVVLACRFDEPFSIATIRWLITIGHDNQARISRALTKLGSAFGLFPRPIGEVELFDVPPFAAVAVGQKTILLGDRGSVEGALRGGAPASPLADQPDFVKLAKRASPSAGLIAYVDQQAFFAGVRGVMLSLGVPAAQIDIPTEPRELRTLTPTIMTLSSTPEGLRCSIHSIAARPMP
ncbi:MAG: hypothetical protein KDA32_04050, partial [Phycisphaerales bacterium]|nr:hypothetical protein [Phycisphaerales bacterium]